MRFFVFSMRRGLISVRLGELRYTECMRRISISSSNNNNNNNDDMTN